jgi:transposase
MLEVALPSSFCHVTTKGGAVAKVVIGVDPHKRMNAVVVVNAKGTVLARRQFANTTRGFRELRVFSRQWRPRTWAIEGCNGTGKHLAQRLVAARETVVDVSTRRSALVRVFAGGNGRKTDDTDAHAIAMVGLHTPDLPVVRPDDRTVTLRLLANRRHELVGLRTQAVCRLHRDLANLVPGGARRALTAKKAKELLAKIRPRDEVGRLRRQLAADQLAGLVALDRRLAELERQINVAVAATPTKLVRIFGVGPISTARILGEVGDVARFRSRHHFASYNGTAPDDAGSGGVPVHRVNLKGNRKLNHAIHMVAITQIRNDTPGRAYYLRKQTQGKTQKEALRALKRKISDAIYRQLVEDALVEMGPGGQTGTTLESSVAGPTPTAGSSDKPQPGPAPQATPLTATA